MTSNGAYLLAACERIERLHEIKRDAEEDIREIYKEVAGNGYDKKALRTVVKRRSQDVNDRTEFETIVELYEQEISNASRGHTRDTRETASETARRAHSEMGNAVDTNPIAQTKEAHHDLSPRHLSANRRQLIIQVATGGSRVRVPAPIFEGH